MGRSRHKVVDSDYAYLVTCTVVEWIPIFMDPNIVEIVLGSLRFLQNSGRLTVYAYVIMENHLHMVVQSDELSKEIGDFKSFTARTIIDLLRERNNHPILNDLHRYKASYKLDAQHQLWQEGAHPQQISDDVSMQRAIEYIHGNPVKRGYVDHAADWRYSSARNYEGSEGLIEVCKEW